MNAEKQIRDRESKERCFLTCKKINHGGIDMKVENGNGMGNTGGVSGLMPTGLPGQGDDAQSKSIRKQIEQKQQELSELSGKEDVSSEEKMKKRQELVKEISDLNMQLRQHQMEKHMQEKAERQKERQKAAEASKPAGGAARSQGTTQAAGFSVEGMSAMLSADASMKQAKIQGSVSNRMENRANIVKAEMKFEKSEKVLASKEAELADVEAKADSAANAQAGSLRDATESAQRAAEAERSNGLKDSENERSAKTDSDNKAGDAEKERDGKTKGAGAEHTEGENGAEQTEKSLSEQYPSVDVRI